MNEVSDKVVDLAEIIDSVPAVVARLSHDGDTWSTWFVTRNISMYGYDYEDFISGRYRWFDIVHPDDRVLLSKHIKDYEEHGIDSFRCYYRLLQKNGDSVPITEFNQVRRDSQGRIVCYDTTVINSAQTELGQKLLGEHARQQLVMNDILMSLHDSDLEHALQIILDRTGAYLDTSRVLLFQDSPDHKTCKVVYEWCNQGITSVKDLDYVITYSTAMPEIYVALQDTGELLVNAGEIPENCREEFESEGLLASAIFAVYLNGDHYGFICFDDCVVERRWDDDTTPFLKNISNLISTVLVRQTAARQLEISRKATQTVLDNVSSYIFVVEPETDRVVFANRAFKKVFGEDCEGRDANDFIKIRAAAHSGPPDSNDDARDLITDVYCEETGQWLGLEAEGLNWVDGRRVIQITANDISVNKLYAEAVEHQAFVDYLTSLPNRSRCDVLLPEAMEVAARADMPGGLMFINLDGFKNINYQFGYDRGDELLISIARYLKDQFPEPSEVFRFGADKFLVLLHHLETRWMDDYLAEIISRAARPWLIQGQEISCTASIGAIKFNGREGDHRQLVRKAEQAMYEAGRAGRNSYRYYQDQEPQ